MTDWALRVADARDLSSAYAYDHPARQTAEQHGGAWVVDCDPHSGDGIGAVDLTTNADEARMFGTEQEAFAFSRLNGLRAMPLQIVHVRQQEANDGD